MSWQRPFLRWPSVTSAAPQTFLYALASCSYSIR